MIRMHFNTLQSKTQKTTNDEILLILQFALTSPRTFINILRIKKNRLTYLSVLKLIYLSKCVRQVKKGQIPGIFVEAGCALGGSAILMALLKNKSRKFAIYDTFAQIPPPSEKDENDAFERYQEINTGKAKGIQNDQYYGYEVNLIKRVEENFLKFNLPLRENRIELHKGYFEDVLKISEPVALAHLDSDWYDSIYTSLYQIVPHLSVEGVIIVDDYYDWRGAKKAVDDFFTDKKDQFEFTFGQQMIVRKKG